MDRETTVPPPINGRDSRGRFGPGNAGRPKSGSKLRENIRKYLEEQWDQFPSWMESLKGKDRIEVYISLLRYGLAPLQALTINELDENGQQPAPRARIELTKLSESALKEVLEATDYLRDNDPDIDFDRLTDDELRSLAHIKRKLGITI